MWFILSLTALFFWSGSDLFSKIGCQNRSERTGPLKMVIAVGLVMGIHAFVQIANGSVTVSWQTIQTYLPVSALYIGSMALGYLGLRYIELSISSPICNTSGAIVVLLYLAMGERPSLEVSIALALVILGVVGLGLAEFSEDIDAREARQKASNMKYAKSLIAILLPILYSVLDALGTFGDSLVLKNLNEDEANVAYELTFFATGLVVFAVLLLRGKFRFTPHSDLPKLIGAGLETVGQVAYIYALADRAILAAPVISCYCLLTVVWSRLILKEKLSWKHYAAIAVAVVGIVLLGIFDPE